MEAGMTAFAAWAYPAIDPVALRLGPLSVRWYGIAYLVAFLAAWWVATYFNRRWELGLTTDDIAAIMLAAVIGVVVGGRLGYVIFYGAGQYWKAPLTIFALWDGGMSFHGGLVGILIAGVIVARRLKVPFLTLCDMGSVAAPVGFLTGRLANFVNGELWGRVSNVPWAMVFPSGGPLPRHPSQLYEAALEGVVLLAIMWWLSRRRRADGELMGWLLLLYGVFRIFVEFFREPDVQVGFLFGGVTMGQLLSIPMVIAGVWLIVWLRRARKAAAELAKPDGPEART
jgi:phosphatidylglycerol:prolipoprotein diacylglycerol transferase